MAGHYFRGSGDEDSGSRHSFTFTVDDHGYAWSSLGGVFSCRKADRGGLLLLEALLRAEVAGRVLDLGCGHGQVALPLASMRPAVHPILVDVNPRALVSARENALRLGLGGLPFVASDGLSGLAPELRFDAVALNPPVRAGKGVIHALVDQAWNGLVAGGRLFVVLRVKQGGWTLLDRLAERHDPEAHVILRKKGYLVMVACRGGGEDGRTCDSSTA